MPEAPKKNKQGKLIARFDILDTPNGRIAYTLAKYGYHWVLVPEVLVKLIQDGMEENMLTRIPMTLSHLILY